MSVGIYPNNYTTPKVSANQNQTGKTENATAKVSHTENQSQPAATPKYDTFTFVSTVSGVKSYDVYENSFLRNVHDDERGYDGLRVSYYSTLFSASTEVTNANLDNGFYNIEVRGRNAYTVELTVARYEELREEAYKAFGHDGELLSKNLDSLDRAFEFHLRGLVRSATLSMEAEKEYAEYAEYRGERLAKWEAHKLGTNKDFNGKAFEASAQNLMKEFAQSYLKRINDGFGFADALKFAMDFMNGAFGKTTSVNNLSFSDYMVFQRSISSNDPLGATAAGNAMLRDKMNKEFNNSSELSEELRALLNTSLYNTHKP